MAKMTYINPNFGAFYAIFEFTIGVGTRFTID